MTADAHEVEVARLRAAYAALPPGAPVRLAKRTSNLFRFRDAGPKTSKTRFPRAPVRGKRLRSTGAWTFPRSATCCALIRPPGRPGSAA